GILTCSIVYVKSGYVNTAISCSLTNKVTSVVTDTLTISCNIHIVYKVIKKTLNVITRSGINGNVLHSWHKVSNYRGKNRSLTVKTILHVAITAIMSKIKMYCLLFFLH